MKSLYISRFYEDQINDKKNHFLFHFFWKICIDCGGSKKWIKGVIMQICVRLEVLLLVVRTWGYHPKKISLLDGLAQILIYSRSSLCLINVGLFVCTILNNLPSYKEPQPACTEPCQCLLYTAPVPVLAFFFAALRLHLRPGLRHSLLEIFHTWLNLEPSSDIICKDLGYHPKIPNF